jgi:hypothetical protein
VLAAEFIFGIASRAFASARINEITSRGVRLFYTELRYNVGLNYNAGVA